MSPSIPPKRFAPGQNWIVHPPSDSSVVAARVRIIKTEGTRVWYGWTNVQAGTAERISQMSLREFARAMSSIGYAPEMEDYE